MESRADRPKPFAAEAAGIDRLQMLTKHPMRPNALVIGVEPQRSDRSPERRSAHRQVHNTSRNRY